MPAVIKQKLQASRRSQVVNGTDFERTFYMFLSNSGSNSIQRGQKREKERKKEKGNAEKVCLVLLCLSVSC